MPLLRYALERRTRQRELKSFEIIYYYEKAITLLSSLQGSKCIIKPTKLFLQREKKKLGSQPGFEPRSPRASARVGVRAGASSRRISSPGHAFPLIGASNTS